MVRSLLKGLIVSCQALKDEPLYGGSTIPKMAKAAILGGANGIRANTVYDIKKISQVLKREYPIIGLIKETYDDSEVYITPTILEVESLIKSNCDVIAIDGTLRARHQGEKLSDLVKYARTNSDKYLMADISTFEEAQNAFDLGFDYISTTLRGYTQETKDINIPDFDFFKKLISTFGSERVVAEGGIKCREELNKVLKLGFEYVVIGSAITRPMLITKYYVDCFKREEKW